MKKIVFASIVAAGLAGAVLGLASPAQADLGHNIWANKLTHPFLQQIYASFFKRAKLALQLMRSSK